MQPYHRYRSMEPFAAQDSAPFSVAPLLDQSQVFDYGADAPYQFGGDYYGEGELAGGMDDNNDQRRRRIARACDMCRKKKIKCDGKMPACSHCENYKTECIFTQVEKKRNPPKGAKYIEGLENRLGRMEQLLRLSGLLGEEDDRTDLGTLEKRLADKASSQHYGSSVGSPGGKSTARSDSYSPADGDGQLEPPNSAEPRRTTTQQRPMASPKSQLKAEKKEGEVEALSETMCSLVMNNCGEARYIGSSSGFSIFSPKGIQWVSEKVGDDSFQRMMEDKSLEDTNNKWFAWKPEVFGDIFGRRIFRPLPPLNEALSLLKDFFDNFNCMFPLFHEPTFMHLVRRQYSRDPYEGSGWWASLNCALAIAHRLRVMSNLVPQEEDQKAWGFLKNAMGVLAELTMRNTDLLSVQALLGMALFLLGTQNQQPSFLLVAAAIRLAHSIGLHKRGSAFNLSAVEAEQRKRVFWIAYSLDKDMCLRSGRPPAQDDDDMNVELPSEDPGDNIGNVPLADGKGKVNLFRLMCQFAVISGKVYKQLYSTKAAKSSDGELLNSIGELDRELEEWKDSIPIDFRPEHEIKAAHTPLILHVVVLHFAYYNCLTTIHRMSVHQGQWTSRLSDYAISGLNARPLNHRVFSSAAICVAAARSTTQLLKYIPQGDYACVWMIIYYPVSALMTLFTNVLQTPQDARVRSDLRLMHQVTSFLGTIAVDEETGGVHRMLRICAEFERVARTVADRAERDAHSRRKRKNKDAHHAADDAGANGAHGDDVDRLSPPATAGLPPEKRASTAATSAWSPGNIARAASPQRPHPAATTTTTASMPTPSLTPPSLAAPLPSLLDSFTPPMHPGHSPAFSAGQASATDPTPSILPSFVPQPGEFPNMFTEFSASNQYLAPPGLTGSQPGGGPGGGGGGDDGPGGDGDGTVALDGDEGAAAAAFQQFAAASQAAQAADVGAAADVWQVPMGGLGGMDWSGWGGMQGPGAHEENGR